MTVGVAFGEVSQLFTPSVRRKWRPLNPLAQLIGTVETSLISTAVAILTFRTGFSFFHHYTFHAETLITFNILEVTSSVIMKTVKRLIPASNLIKSFYRHHCKHTSCYVVQPCSRFSSAA